MRTTLWSMMVVDRRHRTRVAALALVVALLAPIAAPGQPVLAKVRLASLADDNFTGGDMNGQIVSSVSLKSLDQLAVQVWVDQHGGDGTTAKFLELPQSEGAAALDAALLFYPPAVIGGSPRAVLAETLDPALIQPQIDIAAKSAAITHTFGAREILFEEPHR